MSLTITSIDHRPRRKQQQHRVTIPQHRRPMQRRAALLVSGGGFFSYAVSDGALAVRALQRTTDEGELGGHLKCLEERGGGGGELMGLIGGGVIGYVGRECLVCFERVPYENMH